MPVYTKGLIATPCKNLAIIGILLEGALSRFVADEARTRYPDDPVLRRSRFSAPRVELSQGMSLMKLHFTIDRETRTLSLFTRCDEDSREYADSSLVLSLGCAGNSRTLMKLALHALSPLGQCWFDYNDEDGIPYAPLDEARINILQAFAHGYISHFDIRRLVQEYQHTASLDQTPSGFRRFFGMNPCTVKEVEALPAHEEREAAYRRLASGLVLPAVGFMEDYHQECLARARRAAAA